MNNISENLSYINNKIKIFCESRSIDPSTITLIAVTKTVDTERINHAIDCGVTDVGENKVQEVVNKFDQIKKGVRWHLIGHLQSNKVKYIIDKVDLIHSVDSVSLAKEISLRAEKIGRIIDVLVQVNPADEESKFGIEYDATEQFLREISNLENIKVKGLMTIAPYDENLENVRPYFKMMKKKFDEMKKIFEEETENNNKNKVEMKYLSMGMTGDYMVALEEGANIIRIGTGIFGNRKYS